MINQLQDIFIRYSDVRPFKWALLNKLTGNFSRWFIKQIASTVLPKYFKRKPGINLYWKAQQEERISEAIVSFTSFPQRIDVVWLVIECLLRQTRVPSKIVLCLSREQFGDKDALPTTLKNYPENVVEIKMVDGDIRSHKKYWYSVKEYCDSPIIIVDDDIIYDSHLVEDLENVALHNNNVVACCWGGRMMWDNNGLIKPYSQWHGDVKLNEITGDFFLGSGGGTYFPNGSLLGANQPIEDIMSICPYADDIWLNAIIRHNGYRTCLIRKHNSVPEWKITNNKKLTTVNNGNMHYNDIQLEQVRNYFIMKYGSDPFLKM